MNAFCGSPWQVSMRGKQNKNKSFCSGGGSMVIMLCSLQPWFVCLQMLETHPTVTRGPGIGTRRLPVLCAKEARLREPAGKLSRVISVAPFLYRMHRRKSRMVYISPSVIIPSVSSRI